MIGAPILGPAEEPTLQALTAKLVAEERLASGPEEAVERIEKHFDCALETDGRSCRAIEAIRERIARTDSRLACALMICAPHTHWHPEDYILEQFDERRDTYLIGPSKALPSRAEFPLTPISFLFDTEGPIAYEWCDASTSLQEEQELEQLWQGIQVLNDVVIREVAGDAPLPIGVTVNHRFKALWDPPGVGTNEAPAPEDPRYALVTRVALGKSAPDDSVQVAWSAFQIEEFTDRERDLLQMLERLASQHSPDNPEAFFEELEQSARALISKGDAELG